MNYGCSVTEKRKRPEAYSNKANKGLYSIARTKKELGLTSCKLELIVGTDFRYGITAFINAMN
jgi:hypothetical protein